MLVGLAIMIECCIRYTPSVVYLWYEKCNAFGMGLMTLSCFDDDCSVLFLLVITLFALFKNI